MSYKIVFQSICRILLLLTLGLACQPGYSSADSPAQVHKPIPVLVLEGTPYERGLRHGKVLKEQIIQVVALWKNDLQKSLGKPADEVIKRFYEKTDYIPSIKKWTPDLYDEIRGIADGAGIDFKTMYAFQLMDELWNNMDDIKSEPHCSSIGVQPGKNNPAMIAQNMDLEYFRNGYQVLLHVKYPDSSLESYVLTCAGLIGLNGLNNKGIAVCCNAISTLSHSRSGLPVSCIIRGILEKQNNSGAVDFIKNIRHASGQNYIIGTPDKIYDFECSFNKIISLNLPEMVNVLWHTNSSLSNNDYTPAYRKLLDNNGTVSDIDDSRIRLATIRKYLTRHPDALTIRLLQDTLMSRESLPNSICRLEEDKQEVFTFASTIMILSEKPELFVSCGPPNLNPYQNFSFK